MTAKIESAGDLAGMLGDWNTAEYTPEGYPHTSSKTRTIDGVHNKDYVEDGGIMSSQPNFRCASADVADVTSGAKLTTNNEHGVATEYIIRGYEPDGTGTTYLLLEIV